jgi:hypothetical protein
MGNMAHPRVIDDDALRRLLSTLRDTRLSWSVAEIPELVRRLGWTMVDMAPDEGAIAAADWDAGDNEILIGFTEKRVDDINMRIADVGDAGFADTPGRPAARAFLYDALALALAVAEDVLGPPSDRRPGENPEVSWRRADDTIRIERLVNSVSVVWANNEFQDYWDALEVEPE